MRKEKDTYPFKLPPGYFDDFENQLFERITEKGFPESSGLKAPDSYFNNMEARMQELVTAEEKPKTIPLFPKRIMGYAASIAACLIVGIFLLNQENREVTFDSLQLSAIDRYIDEGNLNLDLYDLTTYLQDGDISVNILDSHQIPDRELENYVLESMEGDILWDEGIEPFK